MTNNLQFSDCMSQVKVSASWWVLPIDADSIIVHFIDAGVAERIQLTR